MNWKVSSNSLRKFISKEFLGVISALNMLFLIIGVLLYDSVNSDVTFYLFNASSNREFIRHSFFGLFVLNASILIIRLAMIYEWKDINDETLTLNDVQQIEYFIKNNRLGDAIEKFMKYTEEDYPEITDELLNHLVTFNDIEKERRYNTISHANYRLEKSKIQRSIIYLLRKWENNKTAMFIS